MHAEAWRFLKHTRLNIQQALTDVRVLEIGSLDVNGSARTLFEGCAEYVGIDVQAGRGVDVVADARAYDGAGAFQIAISTEALEHDPEPAAIIACAERALVSGGLLILTAAAPPRLPHRCDGVQGDLAGEHYANITVSQLETLLAGWRVLHLEWNGVHGDVYAVAVRQ